MREIGNHIDHILAFTCFAVLFIWMIILQIKSVTNDMKKDCNHLNELYQQQKKEQKRTILQVQERMAQILHQNTSDITLVYTQDRHTVYLENQQKERYKVIHEAGKLIEYKKVNA